MEGPYIRPIAIEADPAQWQDVYDWVALHIDFAARGNLPNPFLIDPTTPVFHLRLPNDQTFQLPQ